MSGNFLDQFDNFFSLPRKIAKTAGVDVLCEDYEYTWRTYIVYFITNIGIGFTAYTICVDCVNGSWPSVLKSLTIIGAGIQGYVKLVSATRKTNIEALRFMYRTISDIYIHYEGKSLDYSNALKLSLTRVKRVLSYLFTLVVIVIAVLIGTPLFMLVVSGKRTFVLNLFVPYIDLETDFGYYFTFLLHTICVIFACVGNFINDSCCFTYVAHVPLISGLLQCKLRDLDRILEAHPNDMKKSKSTLMEILKWHQKYNEFNQSLKSTFYWVIFVEIATLFVGIISGIVCILLNLWPAAPGFLVYLFAMFYCFCFVGNIVEDANSDVIFYIYDSCWYNLTAREQKMILYMLRNAQQATGILIGDVAPLSMSTALQMTKTFYTISMLLREFLNN